MKTKIHNMVICLIAVLCLVMLTTLVYADEVKVDGSFMEITVGETKVIVDSTISEGLSSNDFQNIIKENPSSDKIKVVSEDKLSTEDIENSSETPLYIIKNGKFVQILIEPECRNQLSVLETKEILDSTDGSCIHIYEVGESDENEITNIAQNAATRATGYYVRTGDPKKTGKPYARKDVFAGSVAKGETKKISYSGSIEFSVTSAESTYYSKGALSSGLRAKLSCTITRTLDSKNMKSGCNSREFRIKYYAQKYTRTQKKIDAKRGTQIGKTRTATVSEPTKYASYSVDTKK